MKVVQKITGVLLILALAPGAGAAEGALATAVVQTSSSGDGAAFDGVVEAVRQTIVAAQVPGTIVTLDLKPGDSVKAGQVVAHIDARAAEQTARSADAQTKAAGASLEVATKELERQKHLFGKGYISQAALDRAQAQFDMTRAQVSAQQAEAAAARTQSGFFVVKAPYAGIVAEVPATVGDMAMPGRALLTLYDPKALRVSATVPESVATALRERSAIRVQVPGLSGPQQWTAATQVSVLPTADAATHSVELRLDLASGIEGLRPGMFARVWLPAGVSTGQRLFVPAAAIVRRAEMTGVYIVDAQGRALLRQVRLGAAAGDRIEVLSGVTACEHVALDPQAAARSRQDR